jgi:hypothetical protein
MAHRRVQRCVFHTGRIDQDKESDTGEVIVSRNMGKNGLQSVR